MCAGSLQRLPLEGSSRAAGEGWPVRHKSTSQPPLSRLRRQLPSRGAARGTACFCRGGCLHPPAGRCEHRPLQMSGRLAATAKQAAEFHALPLVLWYYKIIPHPRWSLYRSCLRRPGLLRGCARPAPRILRGRARGRCPAARQRPQGRPALRA